MYIHFLAVIRVGEVCQHLKMGSTFSIPYCQYIWNRSVRNVWSSKKLGHKSVESGNKTKVGKFYAELMSVKIGHPCLIKAVMLHFLWHTKDLSDFGMLFTFSRCHLQCLSNKVFSIGDAFSKSSSTLWLWCANGILDKDIHDRKGFF